MEERRRQYRVGGQEADDDVAPYIGVGSDGRGRIEAELVDLSVAGAQVKIVNEARVPTHVGGNLYLWLVHRPSRIEAGVAARVVHRREEPGKRVLGLEFTDRHASERLLQPPLAKLFNRRAAFRASPDANEGPVQVTVLAEREARLPLEVGALVDLSTGGLCVDIGAEFEKGMAGHDVVECVFRLPKSEMPVTVQGRLRHRTLRPDGRIRYGIQFVRVDEPGFQRTYEAILAYVVRRQKEMAEAWAAQSKRRGP